MYQLVDENIVTRSLQELDPISFAEEMVQYSFIQ
jgi:hypothetical protein